MPIKCNLGGGIPVDNQIKAGSRNPVQNDVIAAALADITTGIGNLNVWAASGKISDAGYTLSDEAVVTIAVNDGYGNTTTVYYSDGVAVASDGSITLAAPVNSVGIKYTDPSKYTDAQKAIIGKFIKLGSNTATAKTYYTTPGKNLFDYRDTSSYYWTSVYGKQLLGYGEKYGHDYITDVSSTAYPEDGTVGDTTYRYCGTLASGAVRIETGSYVGTGAYGSANATTLTFSFVPELLCIFDSKGLLAGDWWNNQYGNQKIGCPRALTTTYVSDALFPHYNGNGVYAYAKRNDKTISWYANDADAQASVCGQKYYYLAIG